MAQFAVTITVPDINLTNAFNGLQAVYPKVGAETNLAYIKRIIQEFLKDGVSDGLVKLATQAAATGVQDQGVTTS